MKKTSRITAFIMCVIMVFSVTSAGASALVLAPSRPSKITGTSTVSTVTLTWTKVSLASGYCVYQYSGNKWKQIKKTTDTTLKISKLKASSTYKFAVKAYRTKGKEIAYSSQRTISVNTKQMGSIKTLKAAVSGKNITLTWSAASGASGYRIYQRKNDKWVKLKTVSSSTKTYTVKNLKAGSTYSFAVKPYVKATSGTVWGTLKSVKATIKDTTKAKFTSHTAGATAINLKWAKVSGATGYRVYQYKSKKWTKLKDTSSTSYKVTKLKSNTSYSFKVRAYKKAKGKTTWYTASDAYKVKTLKTSNSLGVYRIDKYAKLMKAGTYKMTVVTNDPELGSTPITIAVKGGNMYMETKVEGLKMKMIYTAKNNKTYLVLDDVKMYSVITEKLLGEDIDMSYMISQYGKVNPSGKITSSYQTIGGKKLVCEQYKDAETGTTIKYYFDNDVIYAVDNVDKKGNVSRMMYESFTTSVSSSLFSVPKGYAYINLDLLGGLV